MGPWSLTGSRVETTPHSPLPWGAVRIHMILLVTRSSRRQVDALLLGREGPVFLVLGGLPNTAQLPVDSPHVRGRWPDDLKWGAIFLSLSLSLFLSLSYTHTHTHTHTLFHTPHTPTHSLCHNLGKALRSSWSTIVPTPNPCDVSPLVAFIAHFRPLVYVTLTLTLTPTCLCHSHTHTSAHLFMPLSHSHFRPLVYVSLTLTLPPTCSCHSHLLPPTCSCQSLSKSEATL
ncbi:hypothetical protein HJG60_010463 [Phyllostomus discolor]|uniref:Uncharacterized protein n=1 Tax=Phyllostomus discolor TaxID=89673 RepID=A0A834APB5_9CHIR|nr:hypothetical protein HJG60_010463 [Phyllostomus discolor]